MSLTLLEFYCMEATGKYKSDEEIRKLMEESK